MESQQGARTPLVDPFGRELEDWLRDAPAPRTPYAPDLLVPAVTGPFVHLQPGDDADAAGAADGAGPTDDRAFRRTDGRRSSGRHTVACTPSFPDPPERMALRFDDLEVEVSAASGRSVIERIVFLERQVTRRSDDLARLAAWQEAVDGVAPDGDPELDAARAYARAAFADIIADAAGEAAFVHRAAARRARRAAADAVARTETDATRPVRPAPGLLSVPVSPVSVSTRPTPLVQPATGPTLIDRAAFAAALRANPGSTASTPVVFPIEDAIAVPARTGTTEVVRPSAGSDADSAGADGADGAPGWWARVVARLLRALGRG